MTELPAIRREIVVDAPPDIAFAVFTDRIGAWWPVKHFSVNGAGSSVAFRNGAIIERAVDQPDAVWGTVTRWDPPASIAFTWHPGTDPERASRVSVTFTPEGQRTLVQLEHTRWEGFAEPAAARAEYGSGWPTVLGAYRDLVPITTADHLTVRP